MQGSQYSKIALERGLAEKEDNKVQEVKEERAVDGEQKGVIDDVDTTRVYSRDSYARETFKALEQLRDSSLLTDLTLSTENGQRLHAHSLVLAAVSFLVHHSLTHQRLPKWDEEMEKMRERRDTDRDMNIQTEIFISLGSEVRCVGLAAVTEFAYTGAISALNRDSLAQIQTAAKTLGVPRVLELCRKEEGKMKKEVEKRAEENKVSAEEQMKLTLQSIRQLWKEGVGCDVELEVDGTSFHG